MVLYKEYKVHLQLILNEFRVKSRFKKGVS